MYIWARKSQNLTLALWMLHKDSAHSHKLYLLNAMMNYKKMVSKFLKDKGMKELVIENVVMIFLLYVDGVVLLQILLGDVEKHLRALEEFCMHTKLIVNISIICFFNSRNKHHKLFNFLR